MYPAEREQGACPTPTHLPADANRLCDALAPLHSLLQATLVCIPSQGLPGDDSSGIACGFLAVGPAKVQGLHRLDGPA